MHVCITCYLDQHLLQELFEIAACYYPITFLPPRDDPFGVTNDQLIIALEKCMIGHTIMIQFALPFFLEKLNYGNMSDTKVEKLFYRVHFNILLL